MQYRSEFVPWIWQRNREIGHLKTASLKRPFLNDHVVGDGALYPYMKAVHTWEPSKTTDHTHHGGIFNFDFAPEGSILVAACEKESFLIFDPLNGRLIGHKEKAHSDCVNYIRFLDNRLFATCSDDTTIALWDTRFLKHKIRTLEGHSHWVKNIEYASDQGLLVTSGFDGSIYTWNINSYSEVEHPNSLVFHTRGLMRSKLTPDNSKLVMSTQTGYIIVIHNLDLSTLAKDLEGFRPNMYRLMQISETPLGFGTAFNSLFTRTRNRVEIISDWPVGNEANVIASLQVHPQGWCALSRNTNGDETSEWTCVHDIQLDKKSDGACSRLPSSSSPSSSTASEKPQNSSPVCQNSSQNNSHSDRNAYTTNRFTEPNFHSDNSHINTLSPGFMFNLTVSSSDLRRQRGMTNLQSRIGLTQSNFGLPGILELSDSSVSDIDSEFEDDIIIHSDEQLGSHNISNSTAITISANDSGAGNSIEELLASNSDIDEFVASSSEIEEFLTSNSEIDNASGDDHLINAIRHALNSGSGRQHIYFNEMMNSPDLHEGREGKVHQNNPRLVAYAEEPNVGRGFIKELCFSTDGRLICSPFGFGVRLLAFDPECDELCDCIPSMPVKLYEVATVLSHSNNVVTAKFSPTHCTLVSGCLNGRVTFCQPVL